ncbi:MAG: hypothetical protein ACREP7_05680 [Lysobacter sp.]
MPVRFGLTGIHVRPATTMRLRADRAQTGPSSTTAHEPIAASAASHDLHRLMHDRFALLAQILVDECAKLYRVRNDHCHVCSEP